MLFYAVAGALIAYFYVAPPIRFGYRGKGYSEVGILLAFGVLPVLGSYYVQTGGFDLRALLASLAIGILTTLVLFNRHFLHWQADRDSGKRTLVVVWGEKRALRFSMLLHVLAYVALAACVICGTLPWYSLVALITIVPAFRVYAKLKDSNPPQAYLPLMSASLKTVLRCGLLIVLALLIQGFLR